MSALGAVSAPGFILGEETLKNILTLALLSMTAASFAVVVPNAYAGTDADGAFSLTATATAGRTYQFIIGSNQLASVAGQQITGLRWRLNAAVTAGWPLVDTSYADWEIRVGGGVAANAMSNTFASNFTSGPTLVRDGSHTFTAGSFTSGGSPNAFGPAVMFDSAYTYGGGDLCIEMRFSGQVGATNQPSFDALTASNGPANGWGVDFSSRWTANFAGTSGGNANFLVTDVITQPVPEPATMSVLGLGALALLRRRRK